MTDKRQPTDYSIFIEAARNTLTRVGSVTAFTPQQARSRAAREITAITTAARRSKTGSVTVYSVPATSMKPSSMTVKVTTQSKEKADNGIPV